MNKRKKGGKRIVLRILLILLAIVLIAAAAVLLYVNHKLDRLSYTPSGTAAVPQYSEEDRAILEEESKQAMESGETIASSDVPPEGEVSEDSDIINILLLGTDMRIPNTDDIGRADAIQVISLNRSTGDVKLISFERGIMVPVPGHDRDLLTHAYRWAGPDYMLSIFRDYFLLDMAGYAQVDFDTFTQIIDIMGGIDVELTEMEAWAIDKNNDYHLSEGVNHLNGTLALRYCRLRSIDSNWHRVERQRNAIQAAMNKVKGMSLPELNKLADEILPFIHTDLSKDQISGLLLRSTKFLGSKAEQMTVPLRDANRGSYCDFQFEAERLKEFIYGAEN